VRLFFAVDLPDQVKTLLTHLNVDRDNRDYRWSDASLLHITLAFLGEQPESHLATLEDLARAVAATSAPGALALGPANSMGSRQTPRVLIVDVAGQVERLAHLQADLDRALRAAGFRLEDRPFRPHITLARRRQSARGGPPAGWPPVLTPARIPMHHFSLMRSQLSPRGPTYTRLATFPLAGG
jgi:2'-5' RNA ligase